jgi:hypothetical protein
MQPHVFQIMLRPRIRRDRGIKQMNWIELILDEEYPFRVTSSVLPLSRGFRREIAISGKATIKYRDARDWELDSLTVPASNGKMGKDGQSFDDDVSSGEPLFQIVREYLMTVDRERVENAIEEDIKAKWESRIFDEGKERAKGIIY